MRAQHSPLVDEERVVLGARRVVRREIQRLEVVVVVFDLRTVGHGESNTAEKVLDALDGPRDRVQCAAGTVATWQGHVDRLGSQTLGDCRCLHRLAALTKEALQFLLDRVDLRARRRPLLRRHRRQALEQCRQSPFLAEEIDPQCFKLCNRGSRRKKPSWY